MGRCSGLVEHEMATCPHRRIAYIETEIHNCARSNSPSTLDHPHRFGIALVAGVIVPVVLTVLTLDSIAAFGVSQIFPLLQGMIVMIAAAATVWARRTHARNSAVAAGTWLAVSAGGCCVQVPVISVKEWRAQSRGDSIAHGLAQYRVREKKTPHR